MINQSVHKHTLLPQEKITGKVKEKGKLQKTQGKNFPANPDEFEHNISHK